MGHQSTPSVDNSVGRPLEGDTMRVGNDGIGRVHWPVSIRQGAGWGSTLITRGEGPPPHSEKSSNNFAAIGLPPASGYQIGRSALHKSQAKCGRVKDGSTSEGRNPQNALGIRHP